MQEFPHLYVVSASNDGSPRVQLESKGLDGLESSAPAEFGGPGDRWSPETLMMAAVADCFILTFKAIAAASRFDWSHIQCEATGRLERIDRVTRFTHIATRAILDISDESLRERAVELLHKAEKNCLVANSLSAEKELQAEVRIAQTA